MKVDFNQILVNKQNSIACIKLNRPDVLNALNPEMITELITALQCLEEDDSVNIVILSGAGRAFCAGMDLGEPSSLGKGVIKDIIATYGPWQAIEDMSKPTIAAVHGYAITGGYLLAIACDIVIASDDAQFADTHARLGLIPYGGEPQKLLRMAGIKKAKELMFTSEMITAAEAERYGLVSKVVPRDQLDKAACEMADRILQNSQHSVRTIKRLINFGADLGFQAGLKMEAITSKLGKANSEPDEERDRQLDRFRKGNG